MKYPKDCEARKIGTKARNIVFFSFDADHWDVKEQTGLDVGVDCVAELSENDEWCNRRIECQIKGTKKINYLKNGMIGFDLEIHTINYALSSSIPFILLLVDVVNNIVYYLSIQNYFIDNPDLQNRLSNTSTVRLHLNPANVLNHNDYELQRLTHSRYFRTKNSLIPYKLID